MTALRTTEIEAISSDLLREPLVWLFAEHFRHRQLCSLLDDLAASAVFDRERISAARAFLEKDLPLHMIDEEQDLFPLLQRRCQPTDDMDRILELLSGEHRADIATGARVLSLLTRALETERAPGLDPASRKAFAEFAAQQRRHIGLENAIVLPLARRRLEARDLKALGVRLAARRGQGLGTA